VKIIFYGKLADLLGRELDIEMDRPSTVGAVRSSLIEKHPDATASLQDDRVRACVGCALVSDEHPVTSADRVEFLAPVSGG
jgi:molybdopterin converting factor small subunit